MDKGTLLQEISHARCFKNRTHRSILLPQRRVRTGELKGSSLDAKHYGERLQKREGPTNRVTRDFERKSDTAAEKRATWPASGTAQRRKTPYFRVTSQPNQQLRE